MSTRGLTKLLAANSTRAAWNDWHRTVDKSLGNLRVDLGASRYRENSVLDGLNVVHQSQCEREADSGTSNEQQTNDVFWASGRVRQRMR